MLPFLARAPAPATPLGMLQGGSTNTSGQVVWRMCLCCGDAAGVLGRRRSREQGWVLDAAAYTVASSQGNVSTPSLGLRGQLPVTLVRNRWGAIPRWLMTLASFAAMTSWALHKHQRKPCPESSHPEKANKRGNHQKPCTKQLRRLHRYETQTRMSWFVSHCVQGDVSIAPAVQCWALQKAPHHKYDSTLQWHTDGDKSENLLSWVPKHRTKSCSHRAGTTAGCPECQHSWIPTCSHLVTSSHCCLWSFSSTTWTLDHFQRVSHKKGQVLAGRLLCRTDQGLLKSRVQPG